MGILENMQITRSFDLLERKLDQEKEEVKFENTVITGVMLACFSVLTTGGALWYSQLYKESCPNGFSFDLPCIGTGLLKVNMLGTAVLATIVHIAGATLSIALKNSEYLNLPPHDVLRNQVEKSKEPTRIEKMAIIGVIAANFLALTTGGALWYSQLYRENCPNGFSFDFPCISTGLSKVVMLETAVLATIGGIAGIYCSQIGSEDPERQNPPRKEMVIGGLSKSC